MVAGEQGPLENLCLSRTTDLSVAWGETEAAASLRVASPESLMGLSFLFFPRESEGPLRLLREMGGGGARSGGRSLAWEGAGQGQGLPGFALRLLGEVFGVSWGTGHG